MKKLNRMATIGSFRQVIKHVQHMARYIGQDEDGEPIYDRTAKLPVININGTVKIHGTNAGVSFHKSNLYAQSKKNIITPEKDNAGFASFMELKRDIFLSLINQIKSVDEINTDENIITIFGEWAGKGVQGVVAIKDIEKTFFIFGVKVKPLDEEKTSYWLDHDILKSSPENRIYNINDFKRFDIEVDFGNPLLSQNKMIEMVLEVEKECPVGKFFGISGLGEGIVFTFWFKGNKHVFKAKGDKHSGKSKVKKLKPVDNVKLQKIIDIVNQVTQNWRLVQMYDEVFDVVNGGKGDIKKTGDFIRLVIKDIIKEELDIILDANLIPKDINKQVSNISRKWFMDKLDDIVMNN